MPFENSDFYKDHLADLHNQLLNSPITRTFLTGTNIRFDGSNLSPEDQFELPFGNFSALEFAHLFSIFDGSRVHQQADKRPVQDAPPGLYFTVVNNQIIQSPYKNRLGIYTEQSGEADLFIDGLHIDHYFLNGHKTPPMLGTIAFALCAITAHLAGLSRVSLVAAGGHGFDKQYVGYKVWPKFGFDAPLDPNEVAHVPHIAQCKTVQQVLDTDSAWWEAQGSQRLMTFTLTAHSTSWQKLLSYVSRKLSVGSIP